MSLKNRLYEVLAIRAGEPPRILWLFFHSLWNGAFVAFFVSTALSLFLASFEIGDLPAAYILSAVAAYLTISLLGILERRMSFAAFQISKLVFLLLMTLAFWWASRHTGSDWVAFLMLVMVAPSITLLDLEFWGLAMRLFDIRQGKRLFGLLGSGEVFAGMLGFFMVPLLVARLSRPIHLLLFAAGSLLVAILVAAAITVVFRRQLAPATRPEEPSPETRAGAPGVSRILQDRYFVLLSAVILLLMLAFYVIDFGFLSEVRGEYPTSEESAKFFGFFFGVNRFCELLFRTLVSGRLVGQFGLRLTLMLLPLTMFVLLALALLSGAGDEFFYLVAASKLLWLILWRSVFDPSFRVLYQPLASDERHIFQARVEGRVKQVGILAAGFFLLYFSEQQLSIRLLIGILLPFLAVWIWLLFPLYREYRARLLSSLSAGAQKAVVASPLELLKEHLRGLPAEELGTGVTVLARVDAPAVESQLVEMLEDEDPQVRIAALRFLKRLRIQAVREAVERHAGDRELPEVRAVAQETLRTLDEVVTLAGEPRRLRAKIRSEAPGDRGEAAAALALGRGDQEVTDLSELLWDENQGVRRAALVAAGFVGRPEFWPRIIDQLAAHRFANAAGFALITIGEPMLEDLERAFGKAGQSLDLRMRVLRIYEHLGSPEAQRLLLDKLRFPNRQVRHRALIALSLTGFQARDDQVSAVERQIDEEVSDMFWNASALLDLGADASYQVVTEAIEAEIARIRASILLLLSLLCDPRTIRLVKKTLEAGGREKQVYALEILDLSVSSELKPLVLPALEDLPAPQFLKRLESFFLRQRLEPFERLRAIILRDPRRIGSWTRACAIRALGQQDGRRDLEVLIANLDHPDGLIREVAARTLYELDPDEYHRSAKTLSTDKKRLDRAVGLDGGGEPAAPEIGGEGPAVAKRRFERRSIFGRVMLLRRIDSFARVSPEILVQLATSAEERRSGTGEILRVDQVLDGSVYVLAEGRLQALRRPGDAVFSDPMVVQCGARATPMRTLEPTRLLHLDGERLCELMADHVELVPALVGPGLEPISADERFESGSWEGDTQATVVY